MMHRAAIRYSTFMTVYVKCNDMCVVGVRSDTTVIPTTAVLRTTIIIIIVVIVISSVQFVTLL